MTKILIIPEWHLYFVFSGSDSVYFTSFRLVPRESVGVGRPSERHFKVTVWPIQDFLDDVVTFLIVGGSKNKYKCTERLSELVILHINQNINELYHSTTVSLTAKYVTVLHFKTWQKYVETYWPHRTIQTVLFFKFDC